MQTSGLTHLHVQARQTPNQVLETLSFQSKNTECQVVQCQRVFVDDHASGFTWPSCRQLF